MCRDAGIAKKTNHSLRATGASALFHAGVPEKLIQDVTGHLSNALQLYQRPTEQQRKQVSEVLVQGREFGKENMPASTNSQSSPPLQSSKMFAVVPACAIQFSLVLVVAKLLFHPKISLLTFAQLLPIMSLRMSRIF